MHIFPVLSLGKERKGKRRDVFLSAQNLSILHTFMIIYCEQYHQIFHNSHKVWNMWKYHVSINHSLFLDIYACLPLPKSHSWLLNAGSCKFWSESPILSLEEISRKGITDSKKIFMGIDIYCQIALPQSRIMQL